jgi:hypothetical protein
VKEELERIKKDWILLCLKVLPGHLPEGNEEESGNVRCA